MRIPSRSECLELMEAVELPQNIRRHSILVADAACRLARLASRSRPRLNLPLIEAGGLLHDIAKGICLTQKCNHASVGAALLRQWGFHAVAPIVEQHISLTEEDIRGPVTESLIVNYADKRVRHDQYVTLEERFEDLIDRYGRTSAQKDRLRQRLCLYRELERALFRDLPVEPDSLFTTSVHRGGGAAPTMGRSHNGPRRGTEQHGKEEKAVCGAPGGRQVGGTGGIAQQRRPGVFGPGQGPL